MATKELHAPEPSEARSALLPLVRSFWLRSGVAAASALAVLFAGAAARADDPASDEAAWAHDQPTRRSGVIVGLQGNIGLAMASGYPLDLKKIGRASYYTETPIGLGGMGLAWIGVSLKDWLSFGLGAYLDGLVVGDKNGWGPGGVFRLEGFPLWPLGGVGRDIGLTFDAGTAAVTVSQKDNSATDLIDGGAASYLGGGVFYEGLRFWRMSAGPGVYAGYMWSDTLRHGMVTLDFRVTLYAGSVEAQKKAAAAR
jgi:hypothetical protein